MRGDFSLFPIVLPAGFDEAFCCTTHARQASGRYDVLTGGVEMTPLQVIRSLDALTDAIEVAVARADWSEAVRAADARSRFVIALAPGQPDEVLAALGRMQEIDVRISAVARETLHALITEGWIALYETRLATNALKATRKSPGAGAEMSPCASRADTWFASRAATRQ
ncbi:hypothetical protein [Burkholderia catarinensis]|uniref:hypothetical protein n=1 Tax=Burkholderia catarinensis TaxID=1108140 RepID=UPI000913926F|nr:hypothetical protein [Burkholderia catarinensis]